MHPPPTLALEVTPPRQSRPAVLLRRAALLGGKQDATNVIQRPDRQSSLTAATALANAGYPPVWHLVNRGRARAAIAADLAEARDCGIGAVLCLRGDHAAEDGPETPPIRDVVALARAALPDAAIGVTLSQYAPDTAAALRNLWPKLAAGATYVQTQPVFDLAMLRPLAETIRTRSPQTRILAMAMPLLDATAAGAVAARLGTAIPPGLRARLATEGEAGGWAHFTETLAALAAAPFIDGVALMTYQADPPDSAGAGILTALRAAGLTRAT